MLPYETKAYSAWGASMGRRSTLDKATAAKLYLRRVPARDSGGDYDPGGAYWGDIARKPLYCAWDDEGDAFYVRAPNRDAARAHFPNAKFYR